MKRWPKAVITLREDARVIHGKPKRAFRCAPEKIDRHSPLGYYNYAASYVVGEGLEATHPSAPTTAMYCHAMELYLKSFLRLHGVSAMRLGWIGHDFRKLLTGANVGPDGYRKL
jgi:hypothetical protein